MITLHYRMLTSTGSGFIFESLEGFASPEDAARFVSKHMDKGTCDRFSYTIGDSPHKCALPTAY